MKTATSITLSGTVGGRVWSGYDATKEFSTDFNTGKARPFSREWHGLRDAVLFITNDGDFQHCGLVDAFIEIKTAQQVGKSRKETVYCFPLSSDMKQISDSFVTPAEYDKFMEFAFGDGGE